MKEYIVRGTNIRHNGKLYREGEKIKLSSKDAKRLAKFLEEPKKEGKAASGKKEEPTEGGKKQEG